MLKTAYREEKAEAELEMENKREKIEQEGKKALAEWQKQYEQIIADTNLQVCCACFPPPPLFPVPLPGLFCSFHGSRPQLSLTLQPLPAPPPPPLAPDHHPSNQVLDVNEKNKSAVAEIEVTPCRKLAQLTAEA